MTGIAEVNASINHVVQSNGENADQATVAQYTMRQQRGTYLLIISQENEIKESKKL